MKDERKSGEGLAGALAIIVMFGALIVFGDEIAKAQHRAGSALCDSLFQQKTLDFPQFVDCIRYSSKIAHWTGDPDNAKWF